MNARRADAGNLDADVSADWEFSDQFEKELMDICMNELPAGKILNLNQVSSDIKSDMTKGVDSILLVCENTKVALRSRRGFAMRYGDFTVRSRRLHAKTEYQKISDGTFEATIYLYAWTDNNLIVDWIAVDVLAFRKSKVFSREDNEKHNYDNKTSFRYWTRDELSKCGALLSQKHPGRGVIGKPTNTISVSRRHCSKCRGVQDTYEVLLIDGPHNGNSIRSDCQKCGAFICFPKWYGKVIHD
jgi:hypothetical protein